MWWWVLCVCWDYGGVWVYLFIDCWSSLVCGRWVCWCRLVVFVCLGSCLGCRGCRVVGCWCWVVVVSGGGVVFVCLGFWCCSWWSRVVVGVWLVWWVCVCGVGVVVSGGLGVWVSFWRGVGRCCIVWFRVVVVGRFLGWSRWVWWWCSIGIWIVWFWCCRRFVWWVCWSVVLVLLFVGFFCSCCCCCLVWLCLGFVVLSLGSFVDLVFG